jgi:hypothetical protein
VKQKPFGFPVNVNNLSFGCDHRGYKSNSKYKTYPLTVLDNLWVGPICLDNPAYFFAYQPDYRNVYHNP